ncbi:MAG: hypothetical protein MI807_04800 [Verrucomicrobiales bacterium]|nr:hypothetical protein [Verrucomicrobiales bacterium]
MADQKTKRHNFSTAVTAKIAQKAMYVCSNPTCLRMTGYGTSEGKARSIAEAAHISPASKNGPRSTGKAPDKSAKSESNGIWLCRICHKKIDDDPKRYPAETLRDWKSDHEVVIRNIVGKDLEVALLDLRNQRNYHDECRDLLSFLESKRVLYEGLDQEFPPRVLESLELIRERVAQTRAKVSPDSDAFLALNKIQTAVNEFLRKIGPATDLRNLVCDCRDPEWNKFADELIRLRSGLVIIMKIVAGDAGYRLTWVSE